MSFVISTANNKSGVAQQGDFVVSEDLRSVYQIDNKTGTRRRVKDPALVARAVEVAKGYKTREAGLKARAESPLTAVDDKDLARAQSMINIGEKATSDYLKSLRADAPYKGPISLS